MTNIKGERLININAAANETYIISYGAYYTVSIFNHTDDVVVISQRADYSDNGTCSNCIKIAAGAFYNNLTLPGDKLFITPAADGDISIARLA